MTTRTTSQGIAVYEGGSAASIIAAAGGVPAPDSVDAAIARFANAVALANQALSAVQALTGRVTTAEGTVQQVVDSTSLAAIVAARDAAIDAATQAQIVVGAAADDAQIDAAIANVVTTASQAQAAVAGLVDGSGNLLAAKIGPGLAGLTGVVSATDPAYGLTGTDDNTAALQAALDAAGGVRPLVLPRRPIGQPYVITGPGSSGTVLLKLAPGQVVVSDGAVIQVKGGTGNYKTILGAAAASTDLTGLTLRGLTIDQNTGANPVSNVSTLLTEGTQRFALFVGGQSKQVTLDHVRVRNVDSLNVFYLGGAGMADVRVQDCDFELVGSSTARHDHSTIYTSCDGSTITGNKFRGVAGGLGATTAIETHGPSQVVTGNRIEGYQIGANITGITSLGNDGLIVAHNTFRNVLIGVQLWSWSGANGGLTDCKVTDNYVLLDRDAWALGSSDHPRGICVAQAANPGASTTHLTGLEISRNRIRFKSYAVSLTNDFQNASGIELVNVDALNEVRDLDIADNVVIGAPGPGLRLQMRTRRGRVRGNSWIDCSSTLESSVPNPFWRSGMCFLNDHADLDVYGNRTIDTRSPHKLVQGFATSISGSLVRSEQWDNRVTCHDGAVLPESTQTTGKRFAARAESPDVQPFTAALYYGPQGGGTAALVLNQVTAVGFRVSTQQALDRIGCEVTTAGAAGAVVRLGIYADNGNGMPGALVLDAGTVDATTTGAKELTISTRLPAGLYWLVLAAQGAACTVRTASAATVSARAGVSTLAVATGATPRFGYVHNSVTGALPAAFVLGGQTANPGLVVVRAA